MTDAGADRELAAAAFNATWELLERDRTDAEDLDLLCLALCQRRHWRLASDDPTRIAIADWLASRCLAELGDGPIALRFATSAIDATPASSPAWLRASVQEGLARALAACGDRAGRDEAIARAIELLSGEDDAESRELIESQLAGVPDVA